MRDINTIIIHATATRPTWWDSKPAASKVNEVRRWHVQERGWSDIGYHYLIDRDGTVAPGRPVERAGAHARGHNATSIGIALFGGHGAAQTDRFEDHFTQAQGDALRNLIQKLEVEHPGIRKIIGHNDVANKGCPGFKVGPWLKGAPAKHVRTNPVQSKTVQASAASIAGGAGAAVSAISGLDQYAQYILLGFAGLVVLAGLFIMRERLKAWAAGWR